jgi:hypothetical protein
MSGEDGENNVLLALEPAIQHVGSAKKAVKGYYGVHERSGKWRGQVGLFATDHVFIVVRR